jgi:hypothetical protein
MEPISREELLKEEECCGNGCLNCPYIPKYKKGATEVDEVL